MSKVNIKNVSSAKISLYVPENHIQRELIPGQSFNVEKDIYDDIILDQGIEALVQGHYIVISGLEEDDAPVLSNPVVTATEIGQMLDDLNITKFASFIPNAAPAEKEAIVDLAVEKKITNNAIVSLIKKYCGRDVIELINMRHQEEM